MKCLITATEGNVGREVVQIVSSHFPDWSLFGCDANTPLQNDSRFVNHLLSVDASSENYLSWLEQTISEFSIDLVIPGSDAEILALTK